MANLTYDQLKNTNLAFASKAYRNGGEKAPITVMFECFLPVAQSAKQRMISRALGSNILSRRTFNLAYKEDKFEQDFGMKADTITGAYDNAVELNISVRDLYGEDLIIRRIDTTDDSAVKDENGKLKAGWSVKTVNGMELTYEGALIYTTTDFGDVGEEDVRLKQDQTPEMLNAPLKKAVSSIKENLNKAKVEAPAQVEEAF